MKKLLFVVGRLFVGNVIDAFLSNKRSRLLAAFVPHVLLYLLLSATYNFMGCRDKASTATEFAQCINSTSLSASVSLDNLVDRLPQGVSDVD